MINYSLFKISESDQSELLGDMLFETPYKAFDFLRTLSYDFQKLGAKTKVVQSENPSMLVYNNNVLVFSYELAQQ